MEAKLKSLSERIDTLEEEMEVILMERIRDKANIERYDRMISKREAEIEELKKQIAALNSIEDTLKQRQSTLRRDIKLMDNILSEGHISDANLRLLVERIYISERDGKLDIDIHLKAPFRTHGFILDGDDVMDAWASMDFDYDRIAPIILKQWSEENESMDLLAAVQ